MYGETLFFSLLYIGGILALAIPALFSVFCILLGLIVLSACLLAVYVPLFLYMWVHSRSIWVAHQRTLDAIYSAFNFIND